MSSTTTTNNSSNNNPHSSLYELYKSGKTEELRKRIGDFDKLEAQCKGNKERLLSTKHNKILVEHILSEGNGDPKPAETVASKLAELHKAAKATEAGVTGLIEYNLAVAQAGLGSSSGNYEALRILQELFTKIEDLEYWLACRVCLFLAQMYRRIDMPSQLGFAVLKCLEAYAESRQSLPRDVLLAAADPREIPYERLLRMIVIERSRLASFSTTTTKSSTSEGSSLSSCFSTPSNEGTKPTMKDVRREKDPLKMNAKLGAFYTDTNKPKLALICASKVLGMKGGDTPDMRYRAGVQLLCIGKPKKAFEMLCGASCTMSSNPEYWLRLSECCILRHIRQQRKLKVYEYTGASPSQSGSGVLPGKMRGVRIEYPRRSLFDKSPSIERAPSLAFGAKCCKNVLISLKYQAHALKSEQTQATTNLLALGLSISSSTTTTTNSSSSSVQLSSLLNNFADDNKYEIIKQNALVNLAWISLCSDDYVSAANAAGQVLRSGRRIEETKIFMFLACLYMAEVIAMSGDNSAAKTTMATLMKKGEKSEKVDKLLDEAMALADDAIAAVAAVGAEPLFEKVEHVGASDADVLRNALWTNRGVSKVLVDGDLKKSFECFKKANELYKLSQHTILLQSYLSSLLYNFDEASNLLKKN